MVVIGGRFDVLDCHAMCYGKKAKNMVMGWVRNTHVCTAMCPQGKCPKNCGQSGKSGHSCRQENGLGECTTPDIKVNPFPGYKARGLGCHTKEKIKALGQRL